MDLQASVNPRGQGCWRRFRRLTRSFRSWEPGSLRSPRTLNDPSAFSVTINDIGVVDPETILKKDLA